MPTLATVSLRLPAYRPVRQADLSVLRDLLADFPWSLQHILPFWSGSEHHDFHHMAFVNNFSTSFRWCDHLFGTDTKYQEYRKRITEMKKLNLTKEEFDAMERKLIDAAEQEGLRAEAEVEQYSLTGKKQKSE